MSDDVARRHVDLAQSLLADLGPDRAGAASLPFEGSARRSWSYLPGQRDGLALHHMPRDCARQALVLVAESLQPHAFAQVAAVMALEDVLDLSESGGGRRHRGDYWVTVFGIPGDDSWGWRFEGHHVSINVTVVHSQVRAIPLFLGANPAAVRHAGHVVSRPLGREEDAARELLAALDARQLRRAVVSGEPPADIRTGRQERVEALEPQGVAAAELATEGRRLMHDLVETYLERLPDALSAPHRAALAGGAGDGIHFQWRGSLEPGRPHYYALTGPRLLVEYDNVGNDANHVHTVLRDPDGDFGSDLLALHYARHHSGSGRLLP